MKLTEATQEELLLLQLWELWQDKCIKKQEDGETPEREKELLQAHYIEAGIQPPTKESPLSLMFCSFVGGTDSTRSPRSNERGGLVA